MIQYGEDRFKSGLQAMWKQCFPQDSDAFIAFYFDKIYTNDESLIYLEDGCPVAFLQMIPYPVKIGNEIRSGGYLSGVMTAPDYRKRGYMEKLLNTAFDEMVNKGYAYSFLIPQEEWLFDFYGKYGYLPAFQERQSIFQEVTAPKESLILYDKKVHIYTSLSEIDIPDVYAVYDRFLMEKPNVILKTPQQFEAMLWVFFDEKGTLFANDWGIAFAFSTGTQTVLKEFFYYDLEMKTEFLQAINGYFPQQKITVLNDENAPFLRYKGMIKPLTDTLVSTDIYMSQMLD